MNKIIQLCAAVFLAGFLSTPIQAANIAVIAGSQEDDFFNLIKKGVDDAALVVEANGGSVSYLQVPNYDNFGPDLVTLIQQAMAQNVDGIAIPVWVPDAQVPALKDAAKAGIAIMMFNAGQGVKEDVQGLNYFGSDEYVAGVAGGAYMAKEGARHILCHISVPGATNHETRCEGVVDGAKSRGAEATILRVDPEMDSDVQGSAKALEDKLRSDPSLDAVINLSAWGGEASAIAVQKVGGNHMIGTFDMNAGVLDRIKAGTQKMAIDQQPYLQGFLATTMLAAHIDFGTKLTTEPVMTGPAIVDTSNIDRVLAGVKRGAR